MCIRDRPKIAPSDWNIEFLLENKANGAGKVNWDEGRALQIITGAIGEVGTKEVNCVRASNLGVLLR